MPHYSTLRCSKCGLHCEREALYVKKVVFTEMGGKPKTLKSRTVDHICSECIGDDPDWNRKAYDTPGMKSEALEEVRAIKAVEKK